MAACVEGARSRIVEARVAAARLPAPGRGGQRVDAVVSLTSYPPRFGKLHLTLRTLLTQTAVPEAVELWVAYADLPMLPEEVGSLVGHGLTIRGCEDLGPYKKIVPALRRDPNRVIVTADDDVAYWPSWLAELVTAHLDHPDDVVCHRGHLPAMEREGTFASYAGWELDVGGQTVDPVFPTGMGGVLYPIGALPPETTDAELFTRLCPTADDVWLYWMTGIAGRRARKVGPRRRFVHWAGSQDEGLFRRNLQGAVANDDQVRAMAALFGIPASLRDSRSQGRPPEPTGAMAGGGPTRARRGGP